jgi:hypothetical protein
VITLNNQDRVVLQAPAGDQVVDGQQFTLYNSADEPVTFEYESGYSVYVPRTYILEVPVMGARPPFGIQDGDMFEVDPDGASGPLDPVVFEFDYNNNSNPTSDVVIDFTTEDSQDTLAQNIVDALQTSALALPAKYLGDGQVHVGTSAGYEVSVTVGTLNVPSDVVDASVQDGQTFAIENGADLVVFEFDFGDGLVDPISGNIPIPFNAGETNDEIADNIAAAAWLAATTA